MAPPRTVIATPTTNLSIADLASCTDGEECIAIAVAPKDLAAGAGPGITLRAAPATSEETVALVCDFWEKLGFRPVVERSAQPAPRRYDLGTVSAYSVTMIVGCSAPVDFG